VVQRESEQTEDLSPAARPISVRNFHIIPGPRRYVDTSIPLWHSKRRSFLAWKEEQEACPPKIQDEAKLVPCLLHLCYNQNAGSSERFQSIAARLTRRFREEWLDDLFQVDALAFRALQLLGVAFLNGQDLVKFIMTVATDVFVKGHER